MLQPGLKLTTRRSPRDESATLVNSVCYEPPKGLACPLLLNPGEGLMFNTNLPQFQEGRL